MELLSVEAMGIDSIPIIQPLTEKGADRPLPYKTGETMFGFVLPILTHRRSKSQSKLVAGSPVRKTLPLQELFKWHPTDTPKFGTALTITDT